MRLQPRIPCLSGGTTMNRILALFIVLVLFATTSDASAQLFRGNHCRSPQICQPSCAQPSGCCQPSGCPTNCCPQAPCPPSYFQPCQPCQPPLACQQSCMGCQQQMQCDYSSTRSKAQAYGKCIRECAQGTTCDTFLGQCALHCHCVYYMPAGTNCQQTYPIPNIQQPCPDITIE